MSLRFASPPLEPLDIGVREDGDPALIPIDEASMSIGGLTRAGKSNLVAGIIRQLAVRRHTALVLSDPKFIELVGFHDRASSIALGVEATREHCRWVIGEVLRRYALTCDTKTWKVRRRVTVGPDFPHIVWIVDECAEVFAGKEGAAITAEFTSIMRMCLAAKVSPILCTNRADYESIPTKVRSQCVMRVGFATADEDHSKMTFGVKGVPAHLIPQAHKGVGFFLSDGDRQAVKFRAHRVTDEQIEEVAQRSAALRVPLEHLGLPWEVLSPTLIGVDDLATSGGK